MAFFFSMSLPPVDLPPAGSPISLSVTHSKGTTMNFKVPDMSCGHCTSAIEKSIKAADPAAQVNCDLGARVVHIDSTLTQDQLSAAIKSAGYEASAA